MWRPAAQNSGVCPVSGLLGAPGSHTGNSAKLLSCRCCCGPILTQLPGPLMSTDEPVFWSAPASVCFRMRSVISCGLECGRKQQSSCPQFCIDTGSSALPLPLQSDAVTMLAHCSPAINFEYMRLPSRTKGDIVTVAFSRPLKAANRFQHDWPTGAAKPAVWALGPVSQGSNAQEPIILFHIPNNAVRCTRPLPSVPSVLFHIKTTLKPH